MMLNFIFFVYLIGFVFVDAKNKAPLAHHIGRNGFDGVSLHLSDFQLIDGSEYTTNQGKIRDKRQQICNDLPIFDAFIVVESDIDGFNSAAIHGLVYRCSDDTSRSTTDVVVQKIQPAISEAQALETVISPSSPDSILDSTITRCIYIDHDNGDAQHSAYHINVASVPAYSWFAIVDTAYGITVLKVDTLSEITITETGGNELIGSTQYSFETPSLSLTNDKVIVSDYRYNAYDRAAIACSGDNMDCIDDDVNGGYGPAGDAFQLGNEVVQLFEEWAWNSSLLPDEYTPLHLIVHLENTDNAYFTGQHLVFGDGASFFYPLTVRDVVGHEAAHAFTRSHSNLMYIRESGGMNEAYSDLAGETLEVFAKGYNTWRIGEECTKSSDALRWMYDPPLDGSSVDEWTQSTRDLDVHYSSGVYNKAFYLLYAYGWDVKDIFQVATKANEIYWGPFTTMSQGLCDLLDAAVDIFGDDGSNPRIHDLMTAFATVNVECEELDIEIVREESNLAADTGNVFRFTYNNTDNERLRFVISGGSGDADLIVNFDSEPSIVYDSNSSQDCYPWQWGNEEDCLFYEPNIGTWHVAIYAYESFSELSFAVEKHVVVDEQQIGVDMCQDTLPSDEASWTISHHQNSLDWTIHDDNSSMWTSNSGASWRKITVQFGDHPSLACDYENFITVSGKAEGDSKTYHLRATFENAAGRTVATNNINAILTDTAQEFSLTYNNNNGLATQVTIKEHAVAGVTLNVPVVTIPLSCAFSPRDEESAWNATSGWFVDYIEKTWRSSYNESSRSITVQLSKFCPIEAQYLTVIGRARGSDEAVYRLTAQFEDSSGAIIHSEDTGRVSTIDAFEEYVLSYDNSDSDVTQITITEYGQDVQNNAGYFGLLLKMPIIRVSDRDDTPYNASSAAHHVVMEADPGYDRKERNIGPKIKPIWISNDVFDERKPFDFISDKKMNYVIMGIASLVIMWCFGCINALCTKSNKAYVYEVAEDSDESLSDIDV